MKKILLYLFIGLVAIILFLFVYLKIFENQAKQISQGTPIQNYGVDNSALLVIDIQEIETGQLSTKEYYILASDSLIKKVNLIVEAMDKLDAPVIYIKSEVSDWFINILNNSYAKGSKGTELDKRLLIVSDYIISKDKQDSFSNSRLDSILIGNKISNLIISGLDAAYCINSTIKAAKNRGYNIKVISDAVISETDSLKNINLTDFVEMGVELKTTKEFLNLTDN